MSAKVLIFLSRYNDCIFVYWIIKVHITKRDSISYNKVVFYWHVTGSTKEKHSYCDRTNIIFVIVGKDQFADLYSQTITHGLFTYRLRSEGDFSRKLAFYDMLHSIGILREKLLNLSPIQPRSWSGLYRYSNMLANVDVKKSFAEYYVRHKGEDPVFHV